MNVFLLGSYGYLGSYLQKKLNADTVIDKEKKYDYFINCAAKSSLEYCEENPEESRVSNFEIICRIHSVIPEAKIISFSSYYVYDDEGACNEDSPTTDKYYYTKHKLASEDFVRSKGGVVFRIGKLFGNYLAPQQKLTEAFVLGKVTTVDEVMFNPTSVKQVLRAVEYELENQNFEGIYNLSNKGHTSHYNYCRYIDDVLNIDTPMSIITHMLRSFHNYGRFLMDTTKIERHISLVHWQLDLEDYLKCIA